MFKIKIVKNVIEVKLEVTWFLNILLNVLFDLKVEMYFLNIVYRFFNDLAFRVMRGEIATLPKQTFDYMLVFT